LGSEGRIDFSSDLPRLLIGTSLLWGLTVVCPTVHFVWLGPAPYFTPTTIPPFYASPLWPYRELFFDEPPIDASTAPPCLRLYANIVPALPYSNSAPWNLRGLNRTGCVAFPSRSLFTFSPAPAHLFVFIDVGQKSFLMCVLFRRSLCFEIYLTELDPPRLPIF